jgi:outer membrane protein assembly factor BamA
VKYIVSIFFLINAVIGYSQPTTDTAIYNPKDDFSLSAFPIVFYLPETNLAFGALGITVFNCGKTQSWRKSQVQLGIAYTLKKQFLLFIPYELYFKEKWRLSGELGYYRYFYNYYGIGSGSLRNDLETYDANFPRFISSLSYRITPTIFTGIQYRLDVFDIPKTGPLLTANAPIGILGGTISTIGLALSFDSRDDIFYPRKGVLLNLNAEHASQIVGADYKYSLFHLDATVYKTIFTNHVVVGNSFIAGSVGQLPYFNYFYLSSGKRGRGFNDRRFIDKSMALLQLEYRFPIYNRFRGVAFASTGNVAPKLSNIFANDPKVAYGAGLRFQLSKKQLNHLRFDVAHSVEGFQFYLTIGEAF